MTSAFSVLLCILQVLQLLKASHRPLLLLGGGAVHVDASLLGELVDVLDMPVVYTWMGKVIDVMVQVHLSCIVHCCVW
jgi:glyoxylate carboligase